MLKSGTLVFGDGVTSKTFAIQICSDSISESNETINLALSNPQNGASLGAPNAAALTVVDPTFLQFAAANGSVPEFASSVDLIVTRTGDANGAATVNYATQSGTATGAAACGAGVDFIQNSGTLYFSAGSTSKRIFINLCDDAAQEADENFSVALSNPSAGANVGSPATAVVAVKNDDGFSPSVLTVNAANDQNDGACDAAHCSLREAIAAANLSGATINFSSAFNSPQTITLANGELAINKRLTINGASGNGRITVSGNNQSRVFYVSDGASLTLNSMTVTNGSGTGATNPNENGYGGGIDNYESTVSLTNSTVNGNTAQSDGGGIKNYKGELTIAGSTINNNAATGGGGGGIDNDQAVGAVNITNSTFSGNTATGVGGALNTYRSRTLVTNATVSGNSATRGGGIYSNSPTTLAFNFRNSIVAANTGTSGQPDIYTTANSASANTDSSGNNLIGSTDTNAAIAWQPSDILNQTPQLAPLGNYGGATLTHALLSNSPAINAGNNCVLNAGGCAANDPPTALTFDQRSFGRNGAVDIGAFESNSSNFVMLPNGRVGQNYSAAIVPNNTFNGAAFTYAVTAGSLPPGLSLTGNAFALNRDALDRNAPAATIAVSGVPTGGSGAFNFTITATDGAGNRSAVNYSITILAPTVAAVSIGGRVTVGNRGIARARVSLTNAAGATRDAVTSSFGFYRFSDVAAGETYIFGVRAKGYQFADNPKVRFVGENVDELNFTALP